jgi:hypothetical protein
VLVNVVTGETVSAATPEDFAAARSAVVQAAVQANPTLFGSDVVAIVTAGSPNVGG